MPTPLKLKWLFGGILLCTVVEGLLIMLAIFHFLDPALPWSFPKSAQASDTASGSNGTNYLSLYSTSDESSASDMEPVIDPYLRHEPRIATSPVPTPSPIASPSLSLATAYCDCGNRAPAVTTLDANGLIVPIDYQYISQGVTSTHNGIDFVAATDTPVYAAKAGTVMSADETGYNGGWGHYIVIDHGNGFITTYAHLDTIAVKAGDTVTQGQQIGISGNTGRSTSPHLQFECRQNGTIVVPFQNFGAPVLPYSY